MAKPELIAAAEAWTHAAQIALHTDGNQEMHDAFMGKAAELRQQAEQASDEQPVSDYLPPLRDFMYHSVRGTEYTFSSGGPHTVFGYLNDECLDDIWECINTAARTGGYLRPSPRESRLEAENAAARSYANTLAISMHKQHYADDAPNWQPLPDIVGLLTQIDNMYAGLRNDLEAAKVENKRLVGLPLASLREEREQAIAEVERLWMAIQSHCSAETIRAIESELESK